MTEEKKRAEGIKLKAKLKMLELELRVGKATRAQVEEAAAAYKALTDFKPRPEPMVALATGKAEPLLKKLEGTALPASAQEAISALMLERDEIDRQKRTLSMSLQNIPASVGCKEVTQEIMAFREKWKAITDKIYFVQEYGFLPEQTAEHTGEADVDRYGEQLPDDRFILDKMIKNLNINVNHKWPERMSQAKTEAKKSEYRLRIAKGEMQLEVMRAKFEKLK